LEVLDVCLDDSVPHDVLFLIEGGRTAFALGIAALEGTGREGGFVMPKIFFRSA
jgi:hypothetical protein